ncbi:MAG: acyclic terpene utilization AtuA family protein [Burkholderiales bacterium]
MTEKIVRLGGASGFWGDSSVACAQLVRRGQVDYLVFDYLAELTMSILAAARAKAPDAGYATDFVDVAMKSVIRDIAAKGIKVVSNAGGVNPAGCAAALAKLAAEAGVTLKIAIVEGDDVLARMAEMRASAIREMYTGAELPQKILSANAYLGALPIARALAAGANVVITGRCVDSAVALGPLIHEFGWREDDYDRLAAGSLAGHIIECGCQATGGLFTDWESVPRWDDIGYPILECHADGSFVVTKAPGTGGLVSRAVVAEQMLYEMGDPGAYVLPDVVCDFTAVRIDEQGPERVRVSGARGFAPTPTYKVCATYPDGYRCTAVLNIIGIDAAKKAQRTAEAILARTRAIFRELGLPDYAASRIEVLGAESVYGPHARTAATREAVMRLAVAHVKREALEIFAREIAPAGTSWSPGTTGMGGGRPKVTPAVKPCFFLLDKSHCAASITLDGAREMVAVPVAGGYPGRSHHAAPKQDAMPPPAGPTRQVPLLRLAWGRSGDKGDSANIGIIARRPEFLPLLRAQLTAAAVKHYFSHLVRGEVERFDVPGIQALNFLLHQALGGGGMASLRVDPLAKGYAQMLLDLPLAVPEAWMQRYALD